MPEESFATRLWKRFQTFRKTTWFRATYIVLLGLLVGELFLLTASAIACLAIFLMPISVFVVPYYFGERKPRRFAVNALPVFLIGILLAAAITAAPFLSLAQAVPLRSFPGSLSSPTMALSNGTVSPYRASPQQPFTFRVYLKTTVDGAPGDFNVSVNLTVVNGLSATEPAYPMAFSPGPNSTTNTKNGTWYEHNLTLGESVYGYRFSVTDGRANWTYTDFNLGPITVSGAAFYSFFVLYTAFSMILPFAFYYVIMFMWWYTVRARQARSRMMSGGPEIPKERRPAKPESAGKAAKAAAFTCTNCGADVDETDAKCPKCGAVFED